MADLIQGSSTAIIWVKADGSGGWYYFGLYDPTTEEQLYEWKYMNLDAEEGEKTFDLRVPHSVMSELPDKVVLTLKQFVLNADGITGEEFFYNDMLLTVKRRLDRMVEFTYDDIYNP